MPDYQQNLHMAQFRPLPAEMVRLRAALRGNQADTNRFFLAYQGMIPREEFFNPENLGRIAGIAGGRPRDRRVVTGCWLLVTSNNKPPARLSERPGGSPLPATSN